MNEIIKHVEGILENYDIPFHKNGFCTNSRYRLILEASSPTRLQEIFKQKYRKSIDINDAKELEILLLTYQYISNN